MYLFDPRENKIIDSDNPALLLADIMVKQFSENFVVDNRFWVLVADLANICDGKNHNNRKITICVNEKCKYQMFVDKVDDKLKEAIMERKTEMKEERKEKRKTKKKMTLSDLKKKNMVRSKTPKAKKA